MARTLLSYVGRVKGGPARGGIGRELRFYTDDTLAVAKTLFIRATGAPTQPVVLIPNAGIPRALAANRLTTDAFVTVAIGQTGSYNVGDLIPIYNATQGTVYRVITAITPATGRLDVDSTLGVAFTVANGTMVNATDMEGHLWGWADSATDTVQQVTELGSGRVLPPVQVAPAAPAVTIAVLEEAAAAGTRGTINFIGRSVTAVDDGANNRVNVTIGIAGTEAAPAPEVLADTDTGLWGETGDVLSIVGGGKRMARFVGSTTAVNYVRSDASTTGSYPALRAEGADATVGLNLSGKGVVGIGIYGGTFARVIASFVDVASAVNYVQITNRTTGGGPIISPAGSDTNVDVELRTKGTGVIYVDSGKTNYAYVQGSAGAFSLQAAGGSATVDIAIAPKGSASIYLYGVTALLGASSTDYFNLSGGTGDVNISPNGGSATVHMNIKGKGGGVVRIANNFTDYFYVAGGTGTASITAEGGSANITINVVPKGTGTFNYNGEKIETVGVRVYKTKTADESVNNSTVMQNDDHLSFAVGANERWAVEMYLLLNVKGSSSWKWMFTGPAGVSGKGAWDLEAVAQLTSDPDSFASTAPAIGFAGFTNASFRHVGFIINGGTPGTINLQWAQNTAVVENTQVLAGSWLVAWRVS